MQLRIEPRRSPMLEPMLPLINVVFLLLVFFMVAGQVGPQPPVPLSTPASAGNQSPLAKIPRLSLDDDGQLYLDEAPLSPDRLRDEGGTLLPGPEPRLHADAAVTTAQLRPVLEALRQAGFESVKLITEKVEP